MSHLRFFAQLFNSCTTPFRIEQCSILCNFVAERRLVNSCLCDKVAVCDMHSCILQFCRVINACVLKLCDRVARQNCVCHIGLNALWLGLRLRLGREPMCHELLLNFCCFKMTNSKAMYITGNARYVHGTLLQVVRVHE